MNYKDIGTIGQNCVIGELSKYGLGLAFPLSDNLPFDFIIIAENKLFKAQVKTSTENKNGEVVAFGLCSNNWYNGTSKKYTEDDCDVFILYDLVAHNVFLLTPCNFRNRRSFYIRYNSPKRKNQHNSNLAEDYILSNKRVKEVFNFEPPDLSIYFCDKEKKYNKVCKECGKSFSGNYKNAKYCSAGCRRKVRESKRKVERPTKEQLTELIRVKPLLKIGRQYGVSDNAIRKWAKNYDLDIKQIKGLI